MIKRILASLTALTLLSFLPASPASAATSNCLGHTVRSASSVKQSDGGIIGSIQLCHTSGNKYFAMFWYTDSVTMPENTWAQGVLHHYVDGVEQSGSWSCATSGGSGIIEPGDAPRSWCVSAMIYSVSKHVTFRATGHEYHPNLIKRIAYGATLRCNMYANCAR